MKVTINNKPTNTIPFKSTMEDHYVKTANYRRAI